MPIQDTFKDINGVTLDRFQTEEIAVRNMLGSCSKEELAVMLAHEMNNAELFQWATDENDAFPPDAGE